MRSASAPADAAASWAPTGRRVHAPAAALANGTLAHAFESDNLTKPGAGVHPGATLLPPGLAVAQERGSSGRELITAVVAGFEVMYRIGYATKHSNERRGFHAPGTTGPFGAAVAAGVLLGLDAPQMTNALGIAGSLAGGLMEFARSGTGAMVKRLHLGRAAESGVMAASLAADGFTGPRSVIEGEAGFLKVFCTEWDMADLTRGLGSEYATLNLCLKRFPVHMTAQTARAGGAGAAGGARLHRRRGGSRHGGGHRADGDDQQHRRSDRHHDGAIFHSVLRRAGTVPRSARSGLVR